MKESQLWQIWEVAPESRNQQGSGLCCTVKNATRIVFGGLHGEAVDLASNAASFLGSPYFFFQHFFFREIESLH